MKPKLFLGFESLSAGNGGICRVARLMSKVLDEEVRAGKVSACGVVLNDTDTSHSSGIHFKYAARSRWRFAFGSHKAAFTCSRFIYDFLGMARAHCRCPGLHRPFLAWIHGVEVWERARVDRIAWSRRAAMLLSNSAYTRDRAETLHGGFSRAKVCWLATEEDEPPLIAPVASGPPTVTLIGRFDPDGGYKGHRELIECWPKVVSCVPDARLVFVGGGSGRSLIEEKVAQSPAASRIIFKGFVPEDQLETIWSNTTVFAMPSRGEGFGLVYIEAMRHGLPVVASVHDAAPEINLDGVTGYNVNLDKPDELADRLIYLLKNPDRATELGRRAHERWRSHFRYGCFRDRFLPLLRDFLGG